MTAGYGPEFNNMYEEVYGSREEEVLGLLVGQLNSFPRLRELPASKWGGIPGQFRKIKREARNKYVRIMKGSERDGEEVFRETTGDIVELFEAVEEEDLEALQETSFFERVNDIF